MYAIILQIYVILFQQEPIFETKLSATEWLVMAGTRFVVQVDVVLR